MAKFSVRKPLTVFVVVLAILILGAVAFVKMTPDLLPNMDFPYVIIMTTDPGASPETVEEEITKPMEQAMATLEDIKTISSTSSENYSLVILEFENGVNMDTIGVDIQQNISTLSADWDDTVGTPYVLKINPSILPVEVAAVAMEGMDVIELSDFVENTLTQELEGVSGVARITTMGAVESQVHVLISQEKIDAVNERLAASVNQQLDDAKAELEDTRKELEDARTELEDAQEELDAGKDTLVTQTSAAESTINQQQVAALEGKMQLQQQLVTLTETKTTLETSLAQVQEPLEAKAELDAQKTELTAQAEELRALIAQMEANPSLEPGSEELLTLQTQLTQLETALTQIDTGLSTLDTQLAANGASWETLEAQKAEIEAGLSQVNEGIATVNDAIEQVDAGTLQLSEALATLSGTTSEGLLELADAAAQITVGSTTIDSALEQVDSGLETLEDSRADALDAADLTDSLTMDSIAAILGAQDFAMPAGYVEQDGLKYMVSVGDEIADEDELANLLLLDTGEDAIGPIYLSDVAEIFVTDTSAETYAKLDGEDGVILSFEKQSTAATADVSDALQERFDELEEEYPGLSFVSLMDQGDYIYLIIHSILESLITGAIFAILILFLFLRDIRPTIITLVSIPVSVIFAVVLMYFSGITLNMISLSGLAVAVGMLVDNSIVVIENIYRLRAKGATALQAAVAGTTQVAGAITASTLTTVCVFLPIVFVEGITRELFTDLALTMTYSLLASLIIALTLVPAMAKGMLRKPSRRERKRASVGRHLSAAVSVGRGETGTVRFSSVPRETGEKGTVPVSSESQYAPESAPARIYRASLNWSLKHKWVILLAALLLLVWSSVAAVSQGFSYMPDLDMNTVSITLTMPEDATMEQAVAWSDEVLSRIETVSDLESVGAMMGTSSLLSSSSGDYDVTIYAIFPEGTSGAGKGKEIQNLCADLPCEVSCDSAMLSMSYLTGTGISLNLYSNDMDALQTAAAQTAEVLRAVPGIESVDDGLEDAEPAIHVAVDKNAAMAKGWTVAQIYMDLASALTESATVLDLPVGGTTADVLVEKPSTLTLEDLAERTYEYTDEDGETATFRLDEVATLEETRSMSSINRADQRRYLTVSATVDEDHNVTKVATAVEEALSATTLPEDVTYEVSGENETIMEAVRQLALMLLLGVVLVYFVMVAQFQSLKNPFIVMFTIPLAFTGGFLALLICGLDVSIISLIGFVMLTGIIVNNGIVLIDYVNQLRLEGVPRRQALVEAGITRMRPILMTTLTTVLGLIVMALGRDVGTVMMQPVAVVCIGGLLYATAMTLYVVPCIYDIFNKKELVAIREEDLEFTE